MKLRLSLFVEYRGESFCGWQVQPGLKTVQGELERALALYTRSLAKNSGSILERPIRLTASGRTDSGVHAKMQVASLEWPDKLPFDAARISQAINALTHEDIAVKEIVQAPDNFDARHSPHIKCYRYYIINSPRLSPFEGGLSWHIRRDLDVASMIRAAKFLVGTHDLSSFRASDDEAKSAIRTILRSEISRISAEKLAYTACGKGFLKQMIRIIVGTLVEVGLGLRAPSSILELIAKRDRRAAGRTAPACGLHLEWVRYT